MLSEKVGHDSGQLCPGRDLVTAVTWEIEVLEPGSHEDSRNPSILI